MTLHRVTRVECDGDLAGLVEEVARLVWCQFLDEVPEHWAEGAPHGRDSLLAASAAVETVLGRVAERIKADSAPVFAAAESMPQNLYGRGLRTGVELALASLGKDGE